MKQDGLMHDIRRYGQRAGAVYQMLLGLMALVWIDWLLELAHLLESPSIQRVLMILGLPILLSMVFDYWAQCGARLSMFEIRGDGGELRVEIAPRAATDRFVPIPANYVRYSDAAAPAGVCWELAAYAAQYPEVKATLDQCKQLRGQINNHDAANLLLMALSRQAQKSPVTTNQSVHP